MRVAIVHEWFERYAGSERVVEQFLTMFPQADLYAVVDFMPAAERGFLGERTVRTSFIQHLPFARRGFRNYLSLMPLAVEQFDLADYQLVLSSNHAVAKGVITGPDQVHVSYVHSPMRYAWDLQAQYLRQSGLDRGAKGVYARWILHRLRTWDVRSANGVDSFAANSSFIAGRIQKIYRRGATVVPPPVDVDRFWPVAAHREEYVAIARFVPYKRVDLVVQAFAAMPDRRLTVIGDGPEGKRIMAAAAGHPNIRLRRPVDQSELVALMQQAKALIHAAEEDFGITLVEAQACGTPVIAFGRGGARDIVIDLIHRSPTGVLFAEQTVPSLIDAVKRFEEQTHRVMVEACRANAMRFSPAAFRANMAGVVASAMDRQGLGIHEPTARPMCAITRAVRPA